MSRPLIFATRKSALALAQAELARDIYRSRFPEHEVELMPMSTTGDERLEWSLEKEGGKGLFTSELERAVLEGRADYAIHSGKDLPTEFDAGLELMGFLPREDPHDVLVTREELGDEPPATIATGSPRRRSQMARIYPRAEWLEIRGNVQTRLRKIAEGYADATILAAAGLQRLGIGEGDGLRFRILPSRDCVPAAAQGAIAIQGRRGENVPWLDCICRATTRAVKLERKALALLGGGCHSASAAYVSGSHLHLFDETLGRHALDLRTEEPPDLVGWIKALRGGH